MPSKANASVIGPHYRQSADEWSSNILDGERRRTQTAWRFAMLGVLVAIINGLALLLSPPAQRPVVFKLDGVRSSPNNLPVQALKPGPLQKDPTLTSALLGRYVVAREEFSGSRIANDFKLVELFSAPSVRAAYAASLQRSSGTSIFALYPPNAIVDVRVKGVSLLDDEHALVSFDILRSDLTGAQPAAEEAVVTFAYTTARMREQDRWINPLGLQILDYQRQTAS